MCLDEDTIERDNLPEFIIGYKIVKKNNYNWFSDVPKQFQRKYHKGQWHRSKGGPGFSVLSKLSDTQQFKNWINLPPKSFREAKVIKVELREVTAKGTWYWGRTDFQDCYEGQKMRYIEDVV
jgi:hypothetical protein